MNDREFTKKERAAFYEQVRSQREKTKDLYAIMGMDRALLALKRDSISDKRWLRKWLTRIIGNSDI